jgi:cardiolipin synthase
MQTKSAFKDWDDRQKCVLIDFFNYYTAKGPLDVLISDDNTAEEIKKAIPLDNVIFSYRHRLGGVFTSIEQLEQLPRLSSVRLEYFFWLVDKLDLVKLDALAPKTTWHNQVDVFINGPDCLTLILEEIAKAQQFIHLSVMLFYNDRAGNAVLEALLHALQRGVLVRLMVNAGITAIGYGGKPDVGDFQAVSDKLQAAGGKVINTFHSCNGSEWAAKRTALEQLGVDESSLFLQDLVESGIGKGLDIINHRKFMVIDGVTSILGSLNVGDQYLFETPIDTPDKIEVDGRMLGVPHNLEEWHDGCFRIRGELALPLNQLFYTQWVVLGGDLFDPAETFYFPEIDRSFGDEQCTLFSCFPGNPVNQIQQYFLSLITYPTDEIAIVNPYLIDQLFWDTLRNLGEETSRQIAICNPLMVNDIPTNAASVRSNMYQPFLNGVAYYDYSHTDRFAHWKISYDKQSKCIFHGSYNLNERSAVHDFEVGLLIRSDSLYEKIKIAVDYDMSLSEKITNSKPFFKYPQLHPSYYFKEILKYFS